MGAILKAVSFAGLGLTVVPAFLLFAGVISWSVHAALMLVGTLVWFASAPFWMHGEAPRTSLWKRRRPV